jgi:hypothetical protein
MEKFTMPYQSILRDDVVLKLVILFTINEYGKPLTNPELTKYIMGDNSVDYFLLQHNIYELVKMEKMRVFKDNGKDYYEITTDGTETVGFFLSKIPMIVRKKIITAIGNRKKLDEPQTKVVADFMPEGNEFLAGVKILENGQEQFSLNILVPRREHAKVVCEYFEKNIEDIFKNINDKVVELF